MIEDHVKTLRDMTKIVRMWRDSHIESVQQLSQYYVVIYADGSGRFESTKTGNVSKGPSFYSEKHFEKEVNAFRETTDIKSKIDQFEATLNQLKQQITELRTMHD